MRKILNLKENLIKTNMGKILKNKKFIKRRYLENSKPKKEYKKEETSSKS